MHFKAILTKKLPYTYQQLAFHAPFIQIHLKTQDLSFEEIFSHPNHPYTKALLQGVPTLDTKKKIYTPIKGEIPSPINPPSGCYFHPRCKFSTNKCITDKPSYKEVSPNHFSACHLNS